MPKLSDFVNPLAGSQGFGSPTAGAAIASGALVAIAADGFAYQCGTSDYAAVPNQGNSLFSSTSLTNNAPKYNFPNNPGILLDTSGNVYVLINAGTNTSSGEIVKYSPAGAFLGSCSSGAAATAIMSKMFFMSNGNICCMYGTGSTQQSVFIVNPTTMTAVVNGANLPIHSSSSCFDACPLSGGGFAAIQMVNGTQIQLQIQDAANNAVHTSAAWNTLGGSTTDGYLLAQLSTGNILVVDYIPLSNGAVQVSVYDLTGAQIVAPTTLTGLGVGALSGANNGPVAVSVLPGYFCLSVYNNPNLKTAVYSNACALQGSVDTQALTTNAMPLLVNDGTAFWYATNASSLLSISKITTAGAVTSYGTTATFTGIGAIDIDAGGNIYVFNITLGTITTFSTTLAQQIVTTGALSLGFTPSQPTFAGIKAVGDMAVAFSGSTIPGTGAFLNAFKAADASIIGVSVTSAAKGSPVTCATGVGVQSITKLKGTLSKSFTMKTGADIYGNNGAIVGGLVSLVGM